MLGEAKALGVVMSSDAAKGVEDASDALTRLKAITKGLRDQFVAALAPAVESLTTRFTEFFKKIADEKGGVELFAQNMAISFLNAIMVITKSLDTLITNIGTAFNTLMEYVNHFETRSLEIALKSLTDDADLLSDAFTTLANGGSLSGRDTVNLSLKRIGRDVESVAAAYYALQPRIDAVNQKLSDIKTKEVDWSNVIDSEGFALEIADLISIITGGGDGVGLVPKVVEAVTNMRQAFVDWKDVMPDAQEALRKVATQGADKFTDAFTDAITGAKDFATAMKDMAKSVIDSLIRMLVQYYITKPLFDAITSFGGGGGKYISTGIILIQPFITQVAASPEWVASRSGGVDGKGGFPAILHPNETVIDHTKGGGGGGGVVVNQTINVTTGIQSTVRAEIVQLMPQIAQAAKGAVADARLRGGNFSKAMAGA